MSENNQFKEIIANNKKIMADNEKNKKQLEKNLEFFDRILKSVAAHPKEWDEFLKKIQF